MSALASLWIMVVVFASLLLGGLAGRLTRRRRREIPWYEELWEHRVK